MMEGSGSGRPKKTFQIHNTEIKEKKCRRKRKAIASVKLKSDHGYSRASWHGSTLFHFHRK
jgi:hypothetical protein